MNFVNVVIVLTNLKQENGLTVNTKGATHLATKMLGTCSVR